MRKSTIAAFFGLIILALLLAIPVQFAIEGQFLVAAEIGLLNLLVVSTLTTVHRLASLVETQEGVLLRLEHKIDDLIKFAAKEESLTTYTSYVAETFNKLTDTLNKRSH